MENEEIVKRTIKDMKDNLELSGNTKVFMPSHTEKWRGELIKLLFGTIEPRSKANNTFIALESFISSVAKEAGDESYKAGFNYGYDLGKEDGVEEATDTFRTGVIETLESMKVKCSLCDNNETHESDRNNTLEEAQQKVREM